MLLLSHGVSHRKITMRTTFTQQHLGLAAACALAFSVLPLTALAQQPGENALVTDSRGEPVKSAFGCVHSAFGPAPLWTMGCHPYQPMQAAYVAPEKAAPVYVAAAAPLAVYENVTFDANILFDSDKSALRSAGRDQLDQFVDKIHGLDTQSIVAVGYADRMGSDAANQTLSRERVDAVRTYLVAKGIAWDRVQTSAKGESRPSTYAGECKDANNAKNVACMQPDRHVFIEVSGARVAKQ
jgi:OmpA-OmpF porin, OOP family